MTRSIAIAQELTTFRQVEEKLGLSLSEDSQFFTEWIVELPALTEAEQMRLDQVQRNYLYQASDGILLEETMAFPTYWRRDRNIATIYIQSSKS